VTAYLLDTSVLVDFSKGREPSSTRVRRLIAEHNIVGTCAVNVAEFYAGLAPGRRPEWDEFVQALRYWHISREAAVRAGQDRYRHARQGTAISLPDALVAAVAREHGAVVVTENPRHFPMPDVQVLSLRT
jgi:predicted nucleic acid-binding protein